MDEMNLTGNLQQLMRIHGNLSVTDLANATGIPQPTIHHILSGSTKKPRKKALEALSGYFSVSIEQLIGKESLPITIPESVKENLQLATVPIITWPMVRSWPMHDLGSLHLKELLIDKQVSNHSFALVLQDSSMEPMFPQNSLLVFEMGRKLKDRDFVIVYREQNNTILFDRLFTESNQNYIKQKLDNDNFKLIKLDKEFDRIIASLIEVRIQY